MSQRKRQFRVLATAGMALGLVATRADGPPKRIIHFPADRAVGIVYQRPPHQGTYRHTLYSDDWRRIGEARGDMAVPPNAEVRLDVSHVASKDLTFLDALRPDDLLGMNLRDTAVNNDELEHVGRLSGLRLLDLQSTCITDEGVRHLKGLTRLREINLDAWRVDREGFGVGDGALQIIALAKWTELEAIRLRCTKVTDDGIRAVTFLKSLTEIGVSNTAITDAGVARLKVLPHLEWLQLGSDDEGPDITDVGLEHVGEMLHLKHLGIGGKTITDAGLEHLAKLTDLESLEIASTKVTDAALAHLAPLRKLTSLRAYLHNFTTDVGALHLSQLKALRRLSTHLQVTEVGLRALAELPDLQNLDLAGEGVTDAAMTHLARMKSLKEIWIQLSPITDTGLARLSDLENLEYLLLGVTRVSGEGLRHLQKLPKFNHLSIVFGEPGDDFLGEQPTLKHVGGLKALTSLNLGTTRLPCSELKYLETLDGLETLTIGAMPVDDDAAVYLGSLAALRRLRLSRSILTDAGLAQLSILRNLTSLTVSGRFTRQGLESLKRLNALTQVELSSPNISRDDVQDLAEALPTLQSANWYDQRGTFFADDVSDISVSDKDSFRRQGTREERIKLDALESRPAPDLAVGEWFNGGDDGVTNERLRGKVLLINFWSANCVENAASLEKLERLHDKYKKEGLVILGIHSTDGADALPDFIAPRKLPWPVAADAENATAGAWHVTKYPSYYLVDRSGKLRVARIYRADLERAIKELLAEK